MELIPYIPFTQVICLKIWREFEEMKKKMKEISYSDFSSFKVFRYGGCDI